MYGPNYYLLKVCTEKSVQNGKICGFQDLQDKCRHLVSDRAIKASQ